MNKSTMFNCL